MPLRRRAALVVAAATTLTALTAPVAFADTTPPAPTTTAAPARSDLYGAGDPTYDGVWRQSYALMTVNSSGYFVNSGAEHWLLAEQCADGGFPSYRKDTAKACDPKTEDTNATGIAVQALQALHGAGGSDSPAQRAVAWLRTVQNADGGWSYNPDGPSDPDSTAVVLGALTAVGGAAGSTPDAKGKTPYDALRGFQFGCTAKPADRGAFGYPGTDGKLTVNAKATADAVRGLAGASFVGWPHPTPSATTAAKAPDCTTGRQAYASLDPQAAATAGAGWLAAQLTAGGGHLTALTPGATAATPDYGTTADTVVALVAAGRPAEAKTAYDWLAANSSSWAHGSPAAMSQLILAAYAVHGNPRAAGGADLVQQLVSLGPAPIKRATGAMTGDDKKKDDGGSSSTGTWIIVGVFFVASVGAGLLISGRKRRQG